MEFRPLAQSPMAHDRRMSPIEAFDTNTREVSRAACARCRRLKTKCIVEPGHAGKCKRCVAADTDCLVAESLKKPAKRKENDRVADLEATVERLQNTLEQLRQPNMPVSTPAQGSPIAPPPPLNLRQMPSVDLNLPPLKGLDPTTNTAWPRPGSVSTSLTSSISSRATADTAIDTEGLDELVRSNILTHSQMIDLFEQIRNFMPTGLRIPPSLSFWDMYRSRPILLQMLITIASSSDNMLNPILVERMKNRLLFEYFINNTRRIELVQSFLLNCEYCPPSSYSTFWISHSYAPLATEVALDMNMFEPPRKGQTQAGAYDELEYARTLIWLFVTHTGMLCASRRQPRRVQWTDYHEECRVKLLQSDAYNREMALTTDVIRLQMELLETWPHIKTGAILSSYDQRIRTIGSHFTTKSARSAIAIIQLRALLHELYLRASLNNSSEETQILIAYEILKSEALKLLKIVQSIGNSGENVSSYPSYIFVKPIGALVSICKVYSFTKTPDDGWLADYANKIDQVTADHADQGNRMARYLSGKALGIMRWWASKPEIRMDDGPLEVLQETVERLEAEAATPASDFDFQMFVELFNIDTDINLNVNSTPAI